MKGICWAILIAISVVIGLPVVCESASSGKDYWLVYKEELKGAAIPADETKCKKDPSDKICDELFKYIYQGYYEFDLDDQSDIEKRREEIKLKEIDPNPDKRNAGKSKFRILVKPVVNRNDDAHVVVMSLRADRLECTKSEEGFNQVDASVVPSTPMGIRDTKPKNPEPFVCDLETRDKGNTKITYTVQWPGNITSSASQEDLTPDQKASNGSKGKAAPTASTSPDAKKPDRETKSLLQGQIRVHELYRFRIISGPVFSSLSAKNRSYSTITNAGGQSVISSSKNNDLPVSLPIFLKVYLAPEGRDILEKPNSPWERLSAIVGLNLVDNPLKNFYLGLSLETFPGVDIVGGAHFAKITQLAGGFSDGQQIAAGATPPTSDKFLTGGFVGITADVGVIGSWLGNTIAKTIKDGFK